MKDFQEKMISNFLNTLETKEGVKIAEKIIEDLPEYWFEVAASSSRKYHPYYTINEHGLFLHSMAVASFMNYMLEIDQYKTQFNEWERDCLRIGALCHDGNKHGKLSHGNTIFSHPLVMAETIRNYKGQDLNDSCLDFIADSIETHMGQWNTNKREPNTILPKPMSLGQQLLHLADYLASRKDVEIHFDTYGVEKPTVENYVFDFGKHQGKKLTDVIQTDPSYIDWLRLKNYSKEPLRTFLQQI